MVRRLAGLDVVANHAVNLIVEVKRHESGLLVLGSGSDRSQVEKWKHPGAERTHDHFLAVEVLLGASNSVGHEGCDGGEEVLEDGLGHLVHDRDAVDQGHGVDVVRHDHGSIPAHEYAHRLAGCRAGARKAVFVNVDRGVHRVRSSSAVPGQLISLVLGHGDKATKVEHLLAHL